jgi:dUTP pyrophosphatase
MHSQRWNSQALTMNLYSIIAREFGQSTGREEFVGSVLSSLEIRALIESRAPLFSDFGDLNTQIQANGFDLRLADVARFTGAGTIGIDNADRVLPPIESIDHDADGWLDLEPGAYHIVYAETVSLPKNLMALARPRSSLGRSGVSLHTSVWDAGYSGRSTSLMVVYNPAGFRVQIGARVAQMVFIELKTADDVGYQGVYQGENQR